MALLTEAIALARQGFHLFPLRPGSKLPAVDAFTEAATRDEAQLTHWFGKGNRNIGIATSKFSDDQALVVIDVDKKKGKNGYESLLAMELQGFELPATLEQATPSGGRHLIYVVARPCKQGVDVLGSGIDTRSLGGYVVGPGSAVELGVYAFATQRAPQAAPSWLVDRLGEARPVVAQAAVVLSGVDSDRAQQRAHEWLKTAPVSVEGEGGDITAFKVAATLKDFGCGIDAAFDLLTEQWNDNCIPPWTPEELWSKCASAYKYGKEPQGATAPEAVFPPLPPATGTEEEAEHPVDALNAEYAFIKQGAFVLQETTDFKGRFTTLRLSPNDMHQWFANKTVTISDKQMPLSRVWMARKSRREFDSVVFAPQAEPNPRFYNLWRGFTVAPKEGPHPAVEAFKLHALQNVCGGDEKLCAWLLGFFAHMIQRPWEKPLVALVFKGAKGTGKNALVERVGKLLGPHFLVADDERYLLSNFNAHFEANLFFVLDEASWAGDKRAEGRLKGLITGAAHNIERKGAESYTIDNITRVAIIGNEKWLVPASQDERRFAVFSVGNGNRQDRKFFRDMRVGMEDGGYAHLLHFLMAYDLSGLDVDQAPATKGLTEQKHASLDPVQEWWLDCLASDQLHGSSFTDVIPPQVPHDRLYDAFSTWARKRNIRSRLPASKPFMAAMNSIAPRFDTHRPRAEDGTQTYTKFNPGIDALRADWEQFIGGAVNWTEHH